MVDDTLIVVSLEPWKAVTRIKRKSLRAHTKMDTTMYPEGIRKSQESFTVPVSVSHVNRERGERERGARDGPRKTRRETDTTHGHKQKHNASWAVCSLISVCVAPLSTSRRWHTRFKRARSVLKTRVFLFPLNALFVQGHGGTTTH